MNDLLRLYLRELRWLSTDRCHAAFESDRGKTFETTFAVDRRNGITTATDALEFIIAGASAVGIGTSLFYDPMVARKINAGILEYLESQGLGNVEELVGTLRTGKEVSASPAL